MLQEEINDYQSLMRVDFPLKKIRLLWNYSTSIKVAFQFQIKEILVRNHELNMLDNSSDGKCFGCVYLQPYTFQ